MTRGLQANLLGGVQFKVDGTPIMMMPTRVGQAVLIYLLHQSRPVSREQLIDWFFQENDSRQARANLRRTLSRIKKHVGDMLEANRAEVWVRESWQIELDSLQFDTAVETEKGALQKSLNLYRGDFMAGFYLREAPEFYQWMLVERERLRLIALERYQKLVRLLINSAEFSTALHTLNRLLAIEPLLEPAHRDKMLMLARNGRREAALKHYFETATLFQNELGIELGETTDALLQRIQELKIPPDFVVPKARRDFIGRIQETATVFHTLLQPQHRLITLLGQGGVGKTRLSQAIAHALKTQNAGLFLDGIYFVELMAQRSKENVVRQIAQTMNVKLRGTRPPSEQLLAYLKTKEVLLILDNFDHLVQGTAEYVSNIIVECADVNLLVTSRERLNLDEETVLNIGGLPLTSPDESPSEAEQLFINNAQQHSLAFREGQRERRIIQTICELVDGVPLAIELAAGWLPYHDLANIAIQIQHGLDFLKTRLRNVPERQRSLRAVFLHSWQLLAADLRPLFANLSVFPDTFSLEAAVAVTGVNRAILTNLVNKSLVQQRDNDRFALHPLIQQFAWEMVEDRGEIRGRHADFFNAQVKEIFSADSIPPVTTATILRPNFENIRQGWQHTIQNHSWTALESRVSEMGRYFLQIERVDEGYDLFEEALSMLNDDRVEAEPSLLKAKLNFYQGRMANWHGKLDLGNAKLETALMMAQRIEDDHYVGRSLANLGFSFYRMGEYEKSRDYAHRAIDVSAPIADDYSLMSAYSALGNAEMALKEFDSAEKALQKAVAILSHKKESLGYAMCVANLGNFYNFIHQPEKAMAPLRESIEIFKLNDFKGGVGGAALNLAETLVQLGRYDEAKALLEESYHMRKQVNDRRGLLATCSDIASLAIKQSLFEEAHPYLIEGFELSIGSQANRRIHGLFSRLALYHHGKGNWSEAALFSAYIGQKEGTHAGLFERVESILQAAPEHLSAETLTNLSSQAQALTHSSAIKQALASLT